MSRFKVGALAASAFCAGLASSGPVIAQSVTGSAAGAAPVLPSASQGSTLAEVVVTAQKRSQNVQDVPIAITALSGDQLHDRGIASTEELAAVSPGVTITQFGGAPATTDINIRGIAQLDFGDQQESPNALYVDGAYISFQGAGSLGFFDVKQIEVLRGPEGTLFGRNATGGLVQITSNEPTDFFTGYLEAGYGSYNQYKAEGALSGPLSSDADARFSFLYTRQDPYFHNTLGPSTGADNTLNTRFQLLYKPTQTTSNNLELFATRTFPIAAGLYHPFPAAPNPANHNMVEETNGPLFVQNCANLGYTVAAGATNCLGYIAPSGHPWQTSDPNVGNFQRLLAGITNTLTHEMSWATLTSVTNYTYYDKHYLEEDSADPFPVYGYAADTSAYQASQELRLNGATQAAHWVAGAYVLNIHGHYEQPTFYGDISSPYLNSGPMYSQDVWTYALFDQVDYALARNWTVTLGERIEKDRKRMDLTEYCLPDAATCSSYGFISANEFVSGSIANTEWSGNLQLSYKPSADLMLYAGIRRGTKDAELESPLTPLAGQPITFDSMIVKPEVLTDTEAGFKSTLFGHRMRLNGDVFYYHYADYQAYKYVGLAPILFNAQARDYGAELSTSALFTPNVTGTVSLAYLHTKVMGVGLPDGTISDDQQQPDAPKLSVTADLRKEWHASFGSMFIDGAVVYEGSRYFSTVNEPSLLAPSYVTGNVSVGYTSASGKWSSTLSVDNVNDKAYQVYKIEFASTAGYGEENFAPPRWVSWELRYNF